MNIFSKKLQQIDNEELSSFPRIKGAYTSKCNRTACENMNAVYFNHSTLQYYCRECAVLINRHNHEDSMRLYGHQLCTSENEESFITRNLHAPRSLGFYPIAKGMYNGFWSSDYVNILFTDGKKSADLKVDRNIGGVENRECNVYVTSDGKLLIL